jgi:hypothetical protein
MSRRLVLAVTLLASPGLFTACASTGAVCHSYRPELPVREARTKKVPPKDLRLLSIAAADGVRAGCGPSREVLIILAFGWPILVPACLIWALVDAIVKAIREAYPRDPAPSDGCGCAAPAGK